MTTLTWRRGEPGPQVLARTSSSTIRGLGRRVSILSCLEDFNIEGFSEIQDLLKIKDLHTTYPETSRSRYNLNEKKLK